MTLGPKALLTPRNRMRGSEEATAVGAAIALTRVQGATRKYSSSNSHRRAARRTAMSHSIQPRRREVLGARPHQGLTVKSSIHTVPTAVISTLRAGWENFKLWAVPAATAQSALLVS